MSDLKFEPPKVKVSIIDDDVLYRDSIKKILVREPRIHIYREYSSAIPFIEDLDSPFQPDTCLIDLLLPEMSGLECGLILRNKLPEMHIIFMTAYPTSDSYNIAKQINADYIQKGTLGEVIINKIITNQEESNFYSLEENLEQSKDRALEMMQSFIDIQEKFSILTKTQKEVLRYRKENMSINEIAAILELSPTAVTTHLSRALKKLELPNLLDYLDMGE